MTDEFKPGPCRWCDSEGDVFVDNGLCEDCDRDVIRCEICGEEQHYQDSCRHVFTDEHLEWCGSGVGYATDAVKAAFLLLVSRMPGGFADHLRVAIEARSFHSWMVAPLIGGGGILTLHGMPNDVGRKYGDAMIALGEGDDAEAMHDGYMWLASLYDDQTDEACRLTLMWLDEQPAVAA